MPRCWPSSWPPPEAGASWLPWLTTASALAIAGFRLSRKQIPARLANGVDRRVDPVQNGLGILHSGRVGDYVMWIMVGLGLFAVTFSLT